MRAAKLEELRRAIFNIEKAFQYSSVNTVSHDLFAYLVQILAPLKENSDYKVKNLVYFVYSIIDEGLMKQIMVSFDVRSLFT